MKTLAGEDVSPLMLDAVAYPLLLPYEPPPDECGVDALLQYPPRGLTLLLWARVYSSAVSDRKEVML